MNQTRLDAIRARCEAATPGPWEAVNKSVRLAGVVCEFSWGKEAPDGHNGGICNCLGASYGAKKNDPVNEQARGNAAFIAASRTDVPDLLAEVEKLREQLEHADLVLDAYKQDRDEWRRRAEKAEACIPKMLQLMPIGLCKRLCKRAGVNCGTYGDCNPEWNGTT